MESPLWTLLAVCVLAPACADKVPGWITELNAHTGHEIEVTIGMPTGNFKRKAVLGTAVHATDTKNKPMINFQFSVGEAKQIIAITESDQHQPLLTPNTQTNDQKFWTGELARVNTPTWRNNQWRDDVYTPVANVVRNYLKP